MKLADLDHDQQRQRDPVWLKHLLVALVVLTLLVLTYAVWRFIRSDVGPPQAPDMLPTTQLWHAHYDGDAACTG